jgi:hypothetical protein
MRSHKITRDLLTVSSDETHAAEMDSSISLLGYYAILRDLTRLYETHAADVDVLCKVMLEPSMIEMKIIYDHFTVRPDFDNLVSALFGL